MKNLFLILLMSVFSLSCKKSQETTTLSSSKSDTIILKNNDILFISPNEKNIEDLKKKHGEDFYTIADDANNYFSEASSYLDSLKVSYTSYNDDKIIGFKKGNQFIEIPKYKNPWYVIFYDNGNFKTLDLINIREDYSKFFNLKNSVSLDAKKIIDSIAGKRYFVVEEKECDLNADHLKDKIVVLGNHSDVDPQNPDTKIAPILVLLNQQNKTYKILENENIYPNNFGDAFKKLVITNQFFTLELSNEVPNQYISEKYITFKFSENAHDIILSKYGENIDWSDGKKTNILCSEKQFGTILFQDYSSNEIRDKCSE